ncbi:hypothetical protein BKA67DRAFT_572510 [Truncatella angustata]|uniref:PBP domain-containing protein n=1 Tax=Truncatella angustata TaxID=152316 RepID=A0A9P8UH70_9PEZI|nr:uncharacterized protein BKA67DRAFT_572510 [Truncatella angustata]KAH6651957.1 hypothetical protein BKA67DRAFT_572510 [Truncatella angustata]KAH8205680.1 hypothetical protein TruAng_000174 [Truncatella angustata]
MPPVQTRISGHGKVNPYASAVYGEGEVILRLGNGGAGATGLLEALAYGYLATLRVPASISWVANHSRNTQLALLQGHIDIALTYERDQEALAESEGWSVTKGCLFHDHFVIAGPRSDPASIRGAGSPAEALGRIARTRSLFHSRQDGSATMYKEAKLWNQNGLTPWSDASDADWFKQSAVPPAEAVRKADAVGAYLVTDRSTLLRQTGLQAISQTTVFFEPSNGDDELMNSCYGLCSPNTAGDQTSRPNDFIDYLLSETGQSIVNSYGLRDCELPLFASIKEGFARTRLTGGYPRAGRWVMEASP